MLSIPSPATPRDPKTYPYAPIIPLPGSGSTFPKLLFRITGYRTRSSLDRSRRSNRPKFLPRIYPLIYAELEASSRARVAEYLGAPSQLFAVHDAARDERRSGERSVSRRHSVQRPAVWRLPPRLSAVYSTRSS